MRISASLLSLALALGTASASDCYSVGGCGTCESKTSLYDLRDVFCTVLWGGTGHIEWGSALVTLSGNGFDTKQRCYDAFNDIIESCHGIRNGGVYGWNGATLDLNFCTCGRSKIAGEADFKVKMMGNSTLPLVAKDE